MRAANTIQYNWVTFSSVTEYKLQKPVLTGLVASSENHRLWRESLRCSHIKEKPAVIRFNLHTATDVAKMRVVWHDFTITGAAAAVWQQQRRRRRRPRQFV